MSKKLSAPAACASLILALSAAGCSGGSSKSSYEKAQESISNNTAKSMANYYAAANKSAAATSSTPAPSTKLEVTDEEIQRALAEIRAESEAARASSASDSYDTSAKAACMDALNRLNAIAAQAASASLGTRDQFYAWQAAHQRAQAEVNAKCKASPGSGTYSGHSTYGGSTTGTSVESMRARDRQGELDDARRRAAASEGAELPPRPRP